MDDQAIWGFRMRKLRKTEDILRQIKGETGKRGKWQFLRILQAKRGKIQRKLAKKGIRGTDEKGAKKQRKGCRNWKIRERQNGAKSYQIFHET